MKLLLVTVVLSVFVVDYVQGNVVHAKAITKLEQQQQLAKEERIVGGKLASLGQFPWQAFFEYQTARGIYVCGGALISNQWILTAAHCVNGARSFSIRLGTTYSSGSNENSLQEFNSNYALIHENFNPQTLENDVAVIKLPRPASLNQYVQTIQLDSSNVPSGSTLIVSGFGYVKTGGPVSQRLNYVQVKSITNSECKNNLVNIVQSTICTKGSTIESTCQGDSGGPLIRYINGSPRHVGIVSFVSSAGCDKGYPAGYARTESFRAWISSKTGV